jgi:hypothetical protein
MEKEDEVGIVGDGNFVKESFMADYMMVYIY